MFEGLRLALLFANKRLNNSKLLLKSDFPYDAFILYSFSYEEFGKALFIKDYIDKQEKGLPPWLFSSHQRKMEKAKSHLPIQCSNFVPVVKFLNPNKEPEVPGYKVWRRKGFRRNHIQRGLSDRHI